MIDLALVLVLFQDNQPVPTVGFFDILWLLVQTAIALAIVCGLAILIFRYILPRLNAVSFNESIVKVIDGTSLDARKRLVIVETAGKYLLLGVSENGINLVSELDGDAVEKAVAEADSKKSDRKDPFSQVVDRFKKK